MNPKPKTISLDGITAYLVKGICRAGNFAYEYENHVTNFPENEGDKPFGKFLNQKNKDGYALVRSLRVVNLEGYDV